MTIVFNPAYLIVAGLVYLYLILKVRELKRKSVVSERVYVDRSGITSNPPTNYIDVASNKTINFKVGKQDIIICHLPWRDGLNYINKIYQQYAYLKQSIDYKPQNKLDATRNEILYMNTYNSIVGLIYELSAPHAKNKRLLKKELIKKSKKDIMFVIALCQEIIDYWRYMGELIALLARGKTIRATAGNAFTWRTYETDNDGKISIKPRFVPLMRSQDSSTKKQNKSKKS